MTNTTSNRELPTAADLPPVDLGPRPYHYVTRGRSAPFGEWVPCSGTGDLPSVGCPACLDGNVPEWRNPNPDPIAYCPACGDQEHPADALCAARVPEPEAAFFYDTIDELTAAEITPALERLFNVGQTARPDLPPFALGRLVDRLKASSAIRYSPTGVGFYLVRDDDGDTPGFWDAVRDLDEERKDAER